MNRALAFTLAAAPIMTCACACARAPAPPPSSARAPDVPVALSYRLVRTGDGEGPLLSGRSDLDPGGGARVQATGAHRAFESELELRARRTDDGSILVHARYQERGPDGAAIEWLPEIRATRGVPAHAEVSGPGWGRALDLTVQ